MKSENNVVKVYEIDEIVNVFSKYQIIQYVLVCLGAMSVTMSNVNYVFVLGEVDYRCKVPECENVSVPEFKPGWWPNNVDRCKRPEHIEGVLPIDRCKNYSFVESTEPCTDWVYENDYSAISTLNLACNPWLVGLIGTIHNVGVIVSMLIIGYISDKFGRKLAVIICLVGGVLGHFKTVTSSYNTFAFLEFLEAAFTGGSYTPAMVLLIEISNKEKRIYAGVSFACSLYLGETIYACIAMLARDWKIIVWVIYGPAILFLSYIFVLKESPRWLVLNGQTERAKKVIIDMAKGNKVPINEQEIKNVDEVDLRRKFDVENYKVQEGFQRIFKSKEILKRLFVCSYARFTASFVYYGLMMNSVFLPGNRYTNFLLASVMSFPGEFISLYLMNKIGRKLTCMGGFLLSGILNIATGYTPEEYIWLKIAMFLISKMVIANCFTGGVTYSMELFPTSTRGTLVGMCAVTSRVGAMLAPLTPILNSYYSGLTLFIFGGSTLVSSLLLLLVPETKGTPLKDTIDQVEESVTKKDNSNTGIGLDNPGFKNEDSTCL